MRYITTAAYFLLTNAVKGQLWPSQAYKSIPFTAPDLSITITGKTEDGYLFFGPVGNGTTSQAPLIMTDTNDLVWRGPNGVPQNLNVQTLNGDQVLTFWSGYGATAATFGHGFGHVAILDDTYKVAYNICMTHLNLVTPDPATYPGTLKRPCYLDNHESFITEKGTLLATGYNITQYDLSPVGGPVNGWIFDSQFYEIDIATEKVLFKWSSLENIPITKSNYLNTTGSQADALTIGGVTYGNSQANPWDFFHINSIQPVDGGYIVGARNTWSFYMVQEDSGKVEWTLEGSGGGDFILGNGIFFSWQHMPRMVRKKKNSFQLHLFNNDNLRYLTVPTTNATSGLLLDVNTKTKKVTLVRKLLDSAESLYSIAQGSYQEFDDGHVVMGYGTQPVIKEYDSAGNRVYRAQFGPLTGSTTVVGYRAYRQTWHATPFYPPSVYAEPDNNKTNVYMSWNGATDYDGWTIYAGNSEGKLHPVAQVPRKGFETSHTLGKAYKLISVQPTQSGKKLTASKSFTVNH